MAADREPLLPLARRCLQDNTNAAWERFLAVSGNWARAVFLRNCDNPHLADSFEEWFGGWLFEKGKLPPALRAVEQRGGADRSDADQEMHFRNYCWKIIHSGVNDFLKEQKPAKKVHTVDDPLGVPASSAAALDTDRVRQALAALVPDLRVPFWLRYYRVCGELDGPEAEWVASRTNTTRSAVQQRITEECTRHQDLQFPLSSAFIGELLGIPECPKGGYATVDQRVRKALLQIQRYLQRGESESE